MRDDGFRKYRRSQIGELRPYVKGEDMTGISVSEADRKAGSPKAGDMVARNPANHDDQWLVAAAYFAENFEALPLTPLLEHSANHCQQDAWEAHINREPKIDREAPDTPAYV